MTDQTLRAIGEFLTATRPVGSFATQGTATTHNLVLEVDGVGTLRLPVSPEQAGRLCDLARPARYGKGEQTLLDPNVRDTWEVPRDRVHIDQPRWDRTLAQILASFHTELGLAPDRELSAELHSMLVYEPGQFFVRHQDSEKADGMIGTMVLTLPSEFEGGELVVEHQGQRLVDAGSPDRIGVIAFYADCPHEVLPVTSGYRISLTYNLIVGGPASSIVDGSAGKPSIATLSRYLREHFDTPLPIPEWRRNGGPASRPPERLVCLLDHEYTRRGFDWNLLKGADIHRVGTLAEAAASAGLRSALALVEVKQTQCTDDFVDEEWMYGRRRRWEFTDGAWRIATDVWEPFDDCDEDLGPFDGDGPDGHRPADHPDVLGPDDPDQDTWSEIVLTWWLDPSGTGSSISVRVEESELCTGTPSSTQRPFAVETEGYTGNEGNTIERWYRRAALVIVPDSENRAG